MLKIQKTLFITIFISILSSAADKDGDQIWLDINPQRYLTENTKIYSDIGFRKEINSADWYRLIVRPSIAHAFYEGVEVRGGLGFFYTRNLSIDEENIDNLLEIRPFQGLKFTHDVVKELKFSYYFRLAEQFVFNTQTWESLNSLRIRLQLQAMYQFSTFRTENVKGLVSYERFRTVLGSFENATSSRVVLGLEYNYNKDQKLRVETIWQRQEIYLLTSVDDYDAFYFRIRYYPSWGNAGRNIIDTE